MLDLSEWEGNVDSRKAFAKGAKCRQRQNDTRHLARPSSIAPQEPLTGWKMC